MDNNEGENGFVREADAGVVIRGCIPYCPARGLHALILTLTNHSLAHKFVARQMGLLHMVLHHIRHVTSHRGAVVSVVLDVLEMGVQQVRY